MKKKNGFTVMELMVTLGIIAILTAMAVPSYISWLPGYRLRSAANDVHAAIQMARLRAVKENGNTVISYTEGRGGNYRVFVDNNNNQTYDSNDKFVLYGEVPGDVTLSTQINGGWTLTIFDARGILERDAGNNPIGQGNVILSSNTAGSKSISITFTGNIRIN